MNYTKKFLVSKNILLTNYNRITKCKKIFTFSRILKLNKIVLRITDIGSPFYIIVKNN